MSGIKHKHAPEMGLVQPTSPRTQCIAGRCRSCLWINRSRLEPDHTPINHGITEDPIPVQGGHHESQLPLQQEGTGWMKLPTIRHPGVLVGPLFNQGEQPYLLVLPLDQGERPFLQKYSWCKSMQCLMTQTLWKITSSRGRLKTPLLLLPLDMIQIPCTTMLP
jgi:hypothetical protein